MTNMMELIISWVPKTDPLRIILIMVNAKVVVSANDGTTKAKDFLAPSRVNTKGNASEAVFAMPDPVEGKFLVRWAVAAENGTTDVSIDMRKGSSGALKQVTPKKTGLTRGGDVWEDEVLVDAP